MSTSKKNNFRGYYSQKYGIQPVDRQHERTTDPDVLLVTNSVLIDLYCYLSNKWGGLNKQQGRKISLPAEMAVKEYLSNENQ